MQAMDYPDRTFDWVLANHVLEHTQDDAKALSEVLRVLKDDGVCYLSTPVSWETQTIEYGTANPNLCGHYRAYGYDITSRFAGFRWKRIDFRALLSEELRQRYGINPEEVLFELRKVASRA